MPEAKKITKEDLENATLDERTHGDYELLRKVITSRPRIADASDEDIFIKICVIDTTNSTQLFKAKKKMGIWELSKLIQSVNDIDARIERGDPAVVTEIARTAKKKENYNYNPFSFATKFCAYHNRFVYGRDDYSIYDSKVKKWLQAYFSETETERTLKNERWKNLPNYTAFNDCVLSVLRKNGLDGIKDARMKFDRFVWTQDA